MAFRDDREALRARSELLQAELTRVRAEAQALRESAARTHELEEELAEAQRELGELLRLEPVRPRRPRSALVLASVGIGTALAFTTFVVASIATHTPAGAPHPTLTEPGPPPLVPAVTPGRFMPISFTAPATRVVGAAPVREGEDCDVVVAPSAAAGVQCRVTVRCGETLVFGGEGLGYLPCAVANGRPTTGHDIRGLAEEGDPMLSMDLGAGRIVVSNDLPATWAFELLVPGSEAEMMARGEAVELLPSAEPSPVDDGSPITDCLSAPHYSRCIVERIPNPRSAREIRALVEASRDLRDRATQCRWMRVYVQRYGAADAHGRTYNQALATVCSG